MKKKDYIKHRKIKLTTLFELIYEKGKLNKEIKNTKKELDGWDRFLCNLK